MPHAFWITCCIVAALATACGEKAVDYEKIETFQDASVPPLQLDADSDTRVLLVFPHADDEIVCAGLAAHLKEKGATLHLLTLTQAATDAETRRREWTCSTDQLGISETQEAGLINNVWEDIMADRITFWYDEKDSIKAIIHRKIQDFQPHILITYDTEIGGYGHPEHRISAQLTAEIFAENRADTAFVPEKILQITLTDPLESFLVAGQPGYALSRQLTGSTGLPAPDVALNVEKYWPVKNDAGHCYASQARILSKFFIICDPRQLPAHARAFSHEYYTLIDR